jgi:Zn-dependent protease with chaperone function
MVLAHEISHVYHDHTGSRMQELGFLAACQMAIISVSIPPTHPRLHHHHHTHIY